jgi:prepilin-type N-terminal cleavage/methylation domain-containing protein
MTSRSVTPSAPRAGFTLIEVIAALVIFAGGVLAVTRISVSLSERLRYAGLRSEVAFETQQLLDSLSAVDYDSVSIGSWVDSLSIQGLTYLSTVTVTQTGVRVRGIQVTTSPASGRGVTFTGTTYVFNGF